jgi:predicted dehydrogenase
MQEMGVGIVGYGFIGKVHAFAHQAIPFMYDPLPVRARLIGVCTATEASGRKAQESAGFEFATTDAAELLARDDIQIIHCCTPNDAHYSFLRDAIASGKHIYCDKPLTRTVTEADEIATAARLNPGAIRRMTFHYRFIPAILRAQQLIAEDFLGEVYHFRGAYLHAGYLDPKRPRTWRLEMDKSGGGAIMDLGAHLYDLMRCLLTPATGEMTQVNAQLQTRIPQRPDPKTGEMKPVDVDDIAVAQVKTASGAIGVLEASRLATGVQDELRFEIHGSKGAISFNLMEPNFLTIYDASIPEAALGGDRGPQRIESVARFPKPYAFNVTKNTLGWPQMHINSLFDFLSAIGGGVDNGPTFEDGLAANRFVDACQRSAQQAGWASIR